MLLFHSRIFRLFQHEGNKDIKRALSVHSWWTILQHLIFNFTFFKTGVMHNLSLSGFFFFTSDFSCWQFLFNSFYIFLFQVSLLFLCVLYAKVRAVKLTIKHTGTVMWLAVTILCLRASNSQPGCRLYSFLNRNDL